MFKSDLPIVDPRRVPPPWPEQFAHEATGLVFIRVPAGPFPYGAADGDDAAADHERPQRAVDVPEFWIAQTPVTNRHFMHFYLTTLHRTAVELSATNLASPLDHPPYWRRPEGPGSSIDARLDLPVVHIDYADALAYARWARLALPTEQEWEKAARGIDGRLYPWGDAAPDEERCNFGGRAGGLTEPGHYSPEGDSPYGCHDMAGNVHEWTDSWYDASATARVLRGGCWASPARELRVTARTSADGLLPSAGGRIGFRVVLRPR